VLGARTRNRQTISHHRIAEKLGGGGMGLIYNTKRQEAGYEKSAKSPKCPISN
jgi:hypothetical protein